VAVPDPLSGALPPLGRCPPGHGCEQQFRGGHRTHRCSPPQARWCTAAGCPVTSPLFSKDGRNRRGGTAMGARCSALFFQRLWLSRARPRWHCHPYPMTPPPRCWVIVGGAPPPPVWCHAELSGALAEIAPRGTTALFACVVINRGGGWPWPLSWHLIHLCTPFGSWANTIHSLAHLISSFEWDWWASSALHWIASSYGTRWKLWAGRDLVTLGVYRHLDGSVVGGSLSGVGDCLWPWSIACAGSCAFPGRAPKVTLVNWSYY
jgi:hypothetical protein